MDFKSKPFEEYVKMRTVVNGTVCDFPAPFQGESDRVKLQGKRYGVAMRPAMTKAILTWVNYFSPEKAIVYANSKTGTYTVEYSEDGTTEILFNYAPNSSGHTFYGLSKDPFNGKGPYKISANTPSDATAFWIGVIAAALDSYSGGHILDTYMGNLKASLSLQHFDQAWLDMAECQYFLYEAMTGANNTIPMAAVWASGQEECARIDEGTFAPGTEYKVFAGEASWLLGEESATKKCAEVFIPNDPKEAAKLHKFLTRKVKDYAPWEVAMIPPLNPKYSETQIDVDLVSAISRTWKKDQDLQIKNFAFFGPAGSGKSAAEEHLASLLKMPFSRQMCSSGDDETSLFGTIIPVVEGMKEGLTGEAKAIAEVLEASGDQVNLEAVADAIGFPSPQMCMFDKEAALELMGIEDSGEPIMDQRRKALESKIMGVTGKKENKQGVTYKYIPSPLVTGIEHGHMVAIEEPTNVFNQGIFSALYDVLDRNSTGIIRTPIGTIKRHPDFVCMLSSNTSYTGNRDLPGPLKSRFQFLAHFEEPDKKSLADRVMKKLGIAEKYKEKVLKCVEAYKAGNQRAKDLGQSADFEATPRALFCFTDAVIDGEDPRIAFKQYVLPHLANEKEDLDAIWSSISECEIFL